MDYSLELTEGFLRTNGDKEWWVNGQRHREGLPTLEYAIWE